MVTCCSLPSVSVKRRSANLASFSLINLRTSAGVIGVLAKVFGSRARTSAGFSGSAVCVPGVVRIWIKNLRWSRRPAAPYQSMNARLVHYFGAPRCLRAARGAVGGPLSRRRSKSVHATHFATQDTAARGVAILARMSEPRPEASRPVAAAHLPGSDLRAAKLLVGPGLRHPAALRYGDGRGDLSHGDLLARGRARAVERRLRAAFAPAHRRPLRRQSRSGCSTTISSRSRSSPPRTISRSCTSDRCVRSASIC